MNNGIDISTLDHSVGEERLKLISRALRSEIEDDPTCIDEFGKEVSIAIEGKVETYCVSGEATSSIDGVIRLFISQLFLIDLKNGRCPELNDDDKKELTKLIE